MKRYSFFYLSVTAILALAMSFLSYANDDIMMDYYIRAELDLQDGTKITAFLQNYVINGCKYSKADKKFVVGEQLNPDGSTLYRNILTDEYLLKEFLPAAHERFFYKKIYKLNLSCNRFTSSYLLAKI